MKPSAPPSPRLSAVRGEIVHFLADPAADPRALEHFADGVLIAAAFATDPGLGWLTTFAIATHEIPQEIGDYILLLNAGYSRARADAPTAYSVGELVADTVAILANPRLRK